MAPKVRFAMDLYGALTVKRSCIGSRQHHRDHEKASGKIAVAVVNFHGL